MQAGSMLGVGCVQGIRTTSFSNSSPIGIEAGLLQGVPQLDQLSPAEQQASSQASMDDFLDQMLSLASWAEVGGMSKAPWDFNGGSSASAGNIDTGSALSATQKLFTMSLTPSGVLGSALGNQGLSSQARESQDTVNHAEVEDNNMQYSFEDQLITSRLPHHRVLQDLLIGPTGTPVAQSPQRTPEGAQNTLRRISDGSSQGLTRSASVGSGGSEGSGSQQAAPDSQSPPAVAPTWCQPYMGAVLSLPIGKAETFLQRETTSNDTHLLGKRSRDDDEAQAGSHDGLYSSFGGTQSGQAQTTRLVGQQSHQQMQVGQGVSMSPYGMHTGLVQPQGAGAVVTGTARPRVRARRGQATDPHSIAERLRRERIAERMKALQELVPNSNKTDKASMLDEIIEYVKFLQLQVKVLSVSRLGGAGAVAPLVADLPTESHNSLIGVGLGRSAGVSSSSEDGMGVAERQVAQLMEEDMGSAMQYLQGKGLCLMPISLATALSSTNSSPQANSQGGLQSLVLSGERPRVDMSVSTPASNSTGVASGLILSPANSGGDVVGNDSASRGSNGGTWNLKESIQSSIVDKINGAVSRFPSPARKSGVKSNEEVSRRGQ